MSKNVIDELLSIVSPLAEMQRKTRREMSPQFDREYTQYYSDIKSTYNLDEAKALKVRALNYYNDNRGKMSASNLDAWNTLLADEDGDFDLRIEKLTSYDQGMQMYDNLTKKFMLSLEEYDKISNQTVFEYETSGGDKTTGEVPPEKLQEMRDYRRKELSELISAQIAEYSEWQKNFMTKHPDLIGSKLLQNDYNRIMQGVEIMNMGVNFVEEDQIFDFEEAEALRKGLSGDVKYMNSFVSMRANAKKSVNEANATRLQDFYSTAEGYQNQIDLIDSYALQAEQIKDEYGENSLEYKHYLNSSTQIADPLGSSEDAKLSVVDVIGDTDILDDLNSSLNSAISSIKTLNNRIFEGTNGINYLQSINQSLNNHFTSRMNNISEGFSVSGQPKTSLVKGNYGLPIIDTTPKSSEPSKITLEPTPEPRVTPIDDTDIKTIDVKEEKEKVKPWASAKIKSNVEKLNKIKQGIENYTVKQNVVKGINVSDLNELLGKGKNSRHVSYEELLTLKEEYDKDLKQMEDWLSESEQMYKSQPGMFDLEDRGYRTELIQKRNLLYSKIQKLYSKWYKSPYPHGSKVTAGLKSKNPYWSMMNAFEDIESLKGFYTQEKTKHEKVIQKSKK